MKMQAPILTVTLNPALDYSTSAETVVPELKLRCEAPEIDPGGGGINVSRAIRIMEGDSTALVALAGGTGQQMEDLLVEQGLSLYVMHGPGVTRQSLAVIDRSDGRQFRFVMPGPVWNDADVQTALDDIALTAQPGGWVVLSGSNPPGVPDDFGLRLSARLAGKDVRLLVDTSGPALHAMAAGAAGLEILRMDGEEAEDLAGHSLPERADSAAHAAQLVARGVARAVIVARGREGNLIATQDGVWHAEAAKVPIISKVGAGDSFVAGFTLASARGEPVENALGLAAAAASAAVMTPATDLCRPEDVRRLYDARVVIRL